MLGQDWAAACVILNLELLGTKKEFPEVLEGIEGKHTRCLYSTVTFSS